ncbi:hypothetical protein D777_02984 [Marinobacter nitratireducens]|uniref:Uncharacterized protein n=1 Tax=Marinobacter nitratireducens TaxID=1137280 RepID=A0A072MYU3_9GAMM|nr:hypothetical protein D777_02984 [Marinobacter nitratireducens]
MWVAVPDFIVDCQRGFQKQVVLFEKQRMTLEAANAHFFRHA